MNHAIYFRFEANDSTSEPIFLSREAKGYAKRSNDYVPRKPFGNILLKKKKLLGRMHWIGNEVETSEALGIARICTNKGRLSFEGAMLL